MNKTLVGDESAYLELFEDFELNDVERFLCVEFAFEDGTYMDDHGGYSPDKLKVSRSICRKSENAMYYFPEQYPCVVVLNWFDDHDRMWAIAFRSVDFVYLKDFEPCTQD